MAEVKVEEEDKYIATDADVINTMRIRKAQQEWGKFEKLSS